MTLPFFWRSEKSSPIPVVLYTRTGCHLCDEAKRTIAKYENRFGLHLTEVDVDADPQLRNRYDLCVPVVTVEGKERFRGRVNEALFVRLLKQLAAR